MGPLRFVVRAEGRESWGGGGAEGKICKARPDSLAGQCELKEGACVG